MMRFTPAEKIAVALLAGNLAKAALTLQGVEHTTLAKRMLSEVGQSFKELIDRVEAAVKAPEPSPPAPRTPEPRASTAPR